MTHRRGGAALATLAIVWMSRWPNRPRHAVAHPPVSGRSQASQEGRESPSTVGRIRGKVVTRTGEPIRRAEVRGTELRSGQSYVATTGRDGTFEISNLPHGQYMVTAYKNGFVDAAVVWRG